MYYDKTFVCETPSKKKKLFNCLNKPQYSNSSIIVEYDDFVNFSSSKICDSWFDPLMIT
jgi:hypothetical protein